MAITNISHYKIKIINNFVIMHTQACKQYNNYRPSTQKIDITTNGYHNTHIYTYMCIYELMP